MKHQELPMARRALRVEKVAERIGLSVPTVWRRARLDPTFPRPFKLGPQSTAWLEHEVDAWLAQRAASRAEPLA